MTNFQEEREQMVKFQLAARGLAGPRVLAAFGQIPRELFVPATFRDQAYFDGPLPIGRGQTISQPFMVALMTEALQPQPTDRVLEIGTGSGYQAAVLAKLVNRVYSVERIGELGWRAKQVWQQLKIENVELKIGNGVEGWEEKAPFDKIIVTAASDAVPPDLFDQLKVGGILVAPVGPPEVQELIRYIKVSEGQFEEENLGGCRFVPLIGS